jgi:hypothetical protein
MYHTYEKQELQLLPEFESLLYSNGELQAEVGNIVTGLPKIKHYTTVKQVNSSGKLAVSGVAEMNVNNMNPGYFDAANNLVANPGLQKALAALVTSKYKNYAKGSSPSVNDRFSIVLVDLSGNKINAPQYAGWGSTMARYVASTAKMAMLYGVMQLKFDLENYFKANGVTNTAEVSKWLGNFQKEYKLPGSQLNWSKLFIYENYSSGAIKVKTSADLFTTLINAFEKNDNGAASKLLHSISYPYLASALMQSGITHPTNGGLWLVNDYGGYNRPWANRPSVKFNTSGSHNATALSCATYFTLMAQGRLINDASSTAISNILNKACSFFWTANAKAAIDVTGDVPTKCGVWSKYKCDVILINYKNGRCKYVACVLSDLANDATFKLDEMLKDFDALVRANNP